MAKHSLILKEKQFSSRTTRRVQAPGYPGTLDADYFHACLILNSSLSRVRSSFARRYGEVRSFPKRSPENSICPSYSSRK